MKLSLLLFVTIVTLSLACSAVNQNRSYQNDNRTSGPTSSSEKNKAENYSVVLTVPIGEAGISYANVDEQESEPWGPGGFAIDDDGNALIVDTVANRILRFRSDGSQLPPITVPDAVGMTDVATYEGNVYLLDEAARVPAVVSVTTDGQVERREFSSKRLTKGMTGVATESNGAVLLERDRVSNRLVDNSRALSSALLAKPYSVKVPTLQSQMSTGGRGFVSLGSQNFVEIKVDNLIAGLKVLRVTADGSVFVLVDEIVPAATVDLDETIRRYDDKGMLRGTARVPIHDMNTYVENNVGVDKQGQAFAAISRGTFQLVKLNFDTHLDPILSKSSANANSPEPLGTCKQTRAQMIATANKYINNKTSLSLANLDGPSCAGRGKPRYLGATAGDYGSVAYDWGGGDSVESYNTHMQQGQAAGDVDTHNEEDCSSGVDCSGFVTRCWGFKEPVKYSTSTLPGISSEISILDLKPGDILNRAGNHVVMFDRFPEDANGGNGVMDWESTKTNKYDRVIHMRSTWRRLMGYVARRYKNVC